MTPILKICRSAHTPLSHKPMLRIINNNIKRNALVAKIADNNNHIVFSKEEDYEKKVDYYCKV